LLLHWRRFVGVLLSLLLVGAILPFAVNVVHADDLVSLTFETPLQAWTPLGASQQQTLQFARENSIVYQGSYSLNFTSLISEATNHSVLVDWLYNLTSVRPAFGVNSGTELSFAWYIPKGAAAYAGLFVQFTNGKNLTYVSSSANRSAYQPFAFNDLAASWVDHERGIYQDYAAAFGNTPSSLAISGIGVLHYYKPGATGLQTTYYDSIILTSPSPDFSMTSTLTTTAVVVGETADFTITLASLNGFSGQISLSVQSNITAQLSNARVQLAPSQNSSVLLTVPTNVSTPLRSYELNVTATSGQLVRWMTVTLAVSSPSLLVSAATNTLTYSAGQTVALSGQVKDFSGESVQSASIYVQTIGPSANTIYSLNLTSSTQGTFNNNFTIPLNSINGTYTIYLTASKPGYEDGFSDVNIVVGQTNQPAIQITILQITDALNHTRTSFGPGDTVWIWAREVNAGAALNQSMLWFTVDNPQAASVLISFSIGPLNANENTEVGFSYEIGANPTTGVYHSSVLVTNNFIYLGGVILASAETTFIVTQ
jgi:hypothetical protein